MKVVEWRRQSVTGVADDTVYDSNNVSDDRSAAMIVPMGCDVIQIRAEPLPLRADLLSRRFLKYAASPAALVSWS